MAPVFTTNTIIKTCSFAKLVEYMRSYTIPDIPDIGYCKVTDIVDDGNVITKIIKKKLPISKAAAVFLGCSHSLFIYEIEYDDTKIVSKTSNPKTLEKYFLYEETVTFLDLKDGRVSVIRESKTINLSHGKHITSFFAGSPEEEYHEQCLAYISTMLNECK